MSLVRAALRAAVVIALRGNTIAGQRVSDSRIDPLPTDNVNDVLPIVVVYTDRDQLKNMSTGTAEPVFKRSVDLQIEITLAQYTQTPEGEPAVMIPQTDAEAEALLDLFELQVRRALFAPTAAASRVLNIIKGWEQWESIPGRWGEGNNKISARTVVATVWVNDDCMPIWDGVANAETTNPLAIAPYLASILTEIATYPEFATLQTMLGEILGTDELPEVDQAKVFHFTMDPARDGEHPVEFEKTYT